MDQVWFIFCDELTKVVKDRELAIHSFVLLSNHFHLIASTPQANISQCMHQLMSRTSRRLTRAGNRINETYAGRHYKCILQHPSYFLNAYKYNYRNPASAGITFRAEDYEYSTLHAVAGKSYPKIPILEDHTFLSDPLGTLDWINTAPDPKLAEAHGSGLRHQYFKSKKDSRRQLIITESDIL